MESCSTSTPNPVLAPLSRVARSAPPRPRVNVLKIIIVGDASVGKTCLTYRFCCKSFLSNTDATIGVDFHEKTVKIGEEDVKLQLWDTAGQERFRKSMIKQYYRNAHAVVIVYDVTKITTFKSVEGWLKECSAHGLGDSVPRVLVGTKCDRTDEKGVSTFTAQRIADYHGMPLFETSAYLDSENENVNAIFMTLAHKLHSQLPFRVASIDEKYMVSSPSTSSRKNIVLLKSSESLSTRKCC